MTDAVIQKGQEDIMKIYGAVKDWSPADEFRKSPEDRDLSPDLKGSNLPSCEEQVDLVLPGITSCTKELPECRNKTIVKVQVLPQDPLISEPEVIEIDQKLIGKDLKGPRFLVEDGRVPVAIADTEGNFLFPLSDPHFDQVNAFVHCTKTLDMLERFTGHEVPWRSGTEALIIMPDVADSDNSFYNHQKGSLEFNCFDSSALGRTVKSSRSADTISHEVAHAFIDGQRSGYMQNWDDETMAFHEAFADITTLLYSLEYDSTIERNHQRDRRQSQIAKQNGTALRGRSGWQNTSPTQIQMMIIKHICEPPLTISPTKRRRSFPGVPEKTSFAAEYHSFSRLFSGAFYECFYVLYEKTLKGLCHLPDGRERAATAVDMTKAIKRSQEALGSILGHSLDSLPEKKVTFREAALAMIQADNSLYGGADKELMQNVFCETGHYRERRLHCLRSCARHIPCTTPLNRQTLFHFVYLRLCHAWSPKTRKAPALS